MCTISQQPKIFTLSNGLTLIVEEDPTLPLAAVQAWCATGSIHEGAHLGSGLSHLLEHLLFKGTTRRAPGVIAQDIRHHGGNIDAYTQDDRTVYYITIPSTGVPDAIDILADMMMNATLPEEEFFKEQEVIRREFAMQADHPDIISWEFLHQTIFHVSPLREPVIGHIDIFNKLTRDDLVAYYKKRYVPNNLCFVIVGNVEVEKVKAQLEELFNNYPRQSLEPIFVPEEPPQLGKRIRRKPFPIKHSRLHLAWKGPGITSPDAPAMEVLAGILGLGDSALLQQEVCEKKHLVHDIFSKLMRLYQQEGFLWIRTTTDPLTRDAAENEILHQIDLLKARGVTSAEVERSRNLLLFSHWNLLASIGGRAFNYGESWLITGDPCFTERYFEAISQVTPEEVNLVASNYLSENRLTLVSLDPQTLSEKTVRNNKAESNQRKANVIQKFTLPNGLRLLIYEDLKLPLVSMTALFRGGPLVEEEKTSGLTHLLSSTIVKGTSSKSAEQIARTLEQVGGTISNHSCGCGDLFSIDDSFGFRVNVMKQHLQLGFDLFAEILIDPIFPDVEVALEKRKQQTEITAEIDQIRKVASHLLQKNLFGAHPYARRSLGTVESIAGFTPEMVREFYKNYVVGNNGVVAIFGNINAEEILTMATKAFASLPSGMLALSSVPSVKLLTTPCYEQAIQERKQAVIMKGFLGASVTSPDRPSLELLAEICGGMGSRLFHEIREKMGLAYFVDSWNEIGLAPKSFGFFLGVDPKKSTLACRELNRSIKKLIEEGVTHEELDQGKKTLLQNELLKHQSYATFGKKVAKDELMGLGFDNSQHRAKEIHEVTLDQINHTIKKYLGVSGFAEVIVGPASS